MDNTQSSIKKTKFLDLFICSALFLSSFIILSYYPNVFLGIIILLSFGFIIQTIFIKPHSISITEHILIGTGIGLLTANILMAILVHLNEIGEFKEIVLLIFLFFTVTSLIKRKIARFKGYYFKREDIFPWIVTILFFLIPAILRHADFRFPDEYSYLNKFEGIITSGYISQYAQNRYFFHYSYSTILEFAPITFRSTEIISLFFVSMALISTYLLGKELFNKKVGYVAALFLAFNPSFIFYSTRSLPWAPSIFLITSFLYFFYKWIKGQNKINFFISGVFIIQSIFVKMHGIVFLAIALAIILLTLKIKGANKITSFFFLLSAVLVFALFLSSISLYLRTINWNLQATWNLHQRLVGLGLYSRIIHDVRYDIIGVGYKTYITYFSPDLYSMPFVVLFFFGTAALLKEQFRKKLFLLMPIAVYVIFLSFSLLPFGKGIRNFLVVVPLMSIIAAYGITYPKKVSHRIFWILLYAYLAILATMAIYAPRFPHLDFVIPDLPLWIRVLTFSAAFAVIFLINFDWKKEKWQKVKYSIIALVIISSLLNANFFINMQEGYPDVSKNGILEAGKWLSENTSADAKIQSSTWELPHWIYTNIRSNPDIRYPKSTFLSYYIDRTTYAPPKKEDAFLKRIKTKEVDYIVLFTDPLLTTSDETKETYKYLEKYVDNPPPGTEPLHTEYGEDKKVLFKVYKVK